MAHRLDLLTFQLDEIQKADLQIDEDERLMEERRKIVNFQKYTRRYKAVMRRFMESNVD